MTTNAMINVRSYVGRGYYPTALVFRIALRFFGLRGGGLNEISRE